MLVAFEEVSENVRKFNFLIQIDEGSSICFLEKQIHD